MRLGSDPLSVRHAATNSLDPSATVRAVGAAETSEVGAAGVSERNVAGVSEVGAAGRLELLDSLPQPASTHHKAAPRGRPAIRHKAHGPPDAYTNLARGGRAATVIVGLL